MGLNFSINRGAFLQGLRTAQNIADAKSTMPILSNVLLHAIGGDGLLIIATDLVVSMSAEIQSENKSEGNITLAAKDLYSIVSRLPGDTVKFEQIDGYKVVLRSGRSNFRISGLPANDYPKVPDHRDQTWFEVDAETLRHMVNKTLYSVCKDETRFHLNGSYFESDGVVASMVSTDGHRMGKVEAQMRGPLLEEVGVIIPKKGLLELKRLLDEADSTCSIAVEKPYFYARSGPTTLAIKLIDAQYPPYEAILALDNDKRVTVPRQEFILALRRAQLVVNESTGVKLTVEGNRIMVWSGDGKDDAYEILEVEYGGEKFMLAMNPEYICDLLARMEEDNVLIEVKDSTAPVLFREQGSAKYLGAIMPMRLL